MRGIYSASYLASLERASCAQRGAKSLDIGKAFQLIVGTSTGAIIGCALAKGVSLDRIVTLYKENGARIFPQKMPSSFGTDLLLQLKQRPSLLHKGTEALREALTGVFEQMTIKQLWDERCIALAIPAVNMATYRAWVFKTPHDAQTNHRDDQFSLVDVCLATSAAPLYRSLAGIANPQGGHEVFADGGLWANNPILVALVEALRILEHREEEIEIFALGTCGRPEGEIIPLEALDRGIQDWKFGGEAAGVSIAAQEFAFDMIAKLLRPHLKKRVQIIRFPSDKIPAALLQYLDLDETRPEALNALIQHAQRDADLTNSGIQQGTAEGHAIKALLNSMTPRSV
ncbi:MAG: patatin-like phospholipase family protein [Nitrospira sp.]|nr:patatin-like phospholipase family protein [Nitrospira sp.]